MVEININYEGGLRCQNTHGPSAVQVSTDAPVDNNGKGESFSPTDLVATALGSCMATIMGIVAERKGLELEGLNIKVGKHMSTELPRRISKLEVSIEVPLPDDHPARKALEAAALACPVHQSIHPDIEVPILWKWQTT
ncbi:OsmC family protein [Verrucomicrobiaceae bacterium N1E253]|uniref:OsmC family protein n=1 Tax=Oceaniferula marina TaxID=2748318 RepID=A0A851GHL7_9BACT|nr:OsmC family protein [Oceaniferula marina]NWK54100.1 OsmC family protein [Oceaniferula marina]